MTDKKGKKNELITGYRLWKEDNIILWSSMIIPIAVHQPTLFRSISFSFASGVQAVSDSFNHNLPNKIIHEKYLRMIVKPYGKGPYSQIFLQIFNSYQ